jgi:MFS superfamily sulfate permease-like transporter
MQLSQTLRRYVAFIRLVPQPVMLGFVNGLAIVIGSAQLAQFKSASGVRLLDTTFISRLLASFVYLTDTHTLFIMLFCTQFRIHTPGLARSILAIRSEAAPHWRPPAEHC